MPMTSKRNSTQTTYSTGPIDMRYKHVLLLDGFKNHLSFAFANKKIEMRLLIAVAATLARIHTLNSKWNQKQQ